MMSEFEAVIGLEVHVQLATESKIFSKARSRMQEGTSVADEVPNQNTTEVCAGHPGSLPVLNKKAVEYAVRAGLATGCKIQSTSQFSRKHYFYPDSPKGYQISQYDLPLCTDGQITVDDQDGNKKVVRIQRIHMEEDAGKSIHKSGFSLVNLNRAGVPLIEVVTHPDMSTPQEAGSYLRKLYAIVTTVGVCDGNLQEGNFRCDANVSIRPKGSKELGTRTEIKNVNSFRFVEKAIEGEILRQTQVVLSGGQVTQETRLYDSQKNATFVMRTKEDADDYRYFPDPDLPPLILEQEWIDKISSSLPELPEQKQARYQAIYGLSEQDAALLSGSLDLSHFFDQCMKLFGSDSAKAAKYFANFLTGEVMRVLNEAGSSIHQTCWTPQHFIDLVASIEDQSISTTAARQILLKCGTDGGSVAKWIDDLGLRQMSDLSSLEAIVVDLMNKNPKQVEELRSGKDKVISFFVGQAMKATSGKANPSVLQEIIMKKVKE